eukprot:6357493-Amphidinium_carterae.1
MPSNPANHNYAERHKESKSCTHVSRTLRICCKRLAYWNSSKLYEPQQHRHIGHRKEDDGVTGCNRFGSSCL